MSLPARLINVFLAPGEVFDAIRSSPPSAANWLVPALLLIVVSWVGVGIVFSQESIRQQAIEVAERNLSTLKPEQVEQARPMIEKMAVLGPASGFAVLPLFDGFIGTFFWGLVLWGFGAKAFKGGFTYMKAVEAAGLANMVLVLDAIVRTLLALARNNAYASPSLMLLVKDFDPQNATQGLLALANLMIFWLLVTRSVGFARLARVSLVKAAACVFGVWITYTGFFVALGFAAKALFSHLGQR